MRINKYLAQATGMSRRAADQVIAEGQVTINGQLAETGATVDSDDEVRLDGKRLELSDKFTLVMLHKPVGYVCSRDGQGSPTVYELLPEKYRVLKPVGRLDKDSSGLLLLTDNGQLANQLTHPRYAKTKIYRVILDKPLAPADKAKLEKGVILEDGTSRLEVTVDSGQRPVTGNRSSVTYRVAMAEGRNRQIRRSFAALGYHVTTLHRTQFGNYSLDNLAAGDARPLTDPPSMT